MSTDRQRETLLRRLRQSAPPDWEGTTLFGVAIKDMDEETRHAALGWALSNVKDMMEERMKG